MNETAPYRRFRWLAPGEIAGAPHPDLDGGLPCIAEFLHASGVSAIATVCEQPLQPSPAELGFRAIFSPTPDYRPPPDLAAVVREIDAEIAAGGAVVVHCFAGIGRTGTVLAAWLLGRDPRLSAAEAISHVRDHYIPEYARNRFPEHESQEAALVAFAASRAGP